MDSTQLTTLIRSDSVMRHSIWGVFPRDKLPPSLLPGGYIVNTDNSDQRGQHWIALWRSENGHIEFMDPLGQKPEYYGWKFTVPVQWNQRQIQSDDSIACGAFCLYYLYYRSRLVPMSTVLHVFSHNTALNDDIVNKFIKMLM